MRPRRISLSLAASLALVLPAFSSFADDSHYVNMIIGDRASGMGGAYTAVSDDPSGMYYNPAGIVFGSGDEMSASMNAYQKTRTTYENLEELGGIDWNRESGALIPNFFGVTRNFGDWAIGFSYAVPDSSIEDQNQEFLDLNASVDRFLINFREEINVLLFGPSIAWAPDKDLSVGLTLNYFSRKHDLINNQMLFFNDGTSHWQNNYFKSNESGLHPILGVMWTPADRVSVGARLAHTFLFDSDIRIQQSSRGYITSLDPPVYDPDTLTATLTNTDSKREYPYEIGVGAAWFPNNQFMLSGDFTYWTSTGETDFDPGKAATWNAAVGMEYYPSRSWALRAGLFTNRASTDEVETGEANQDPHVDIFGGTLSGTLFSKGTSITIGGVYSRGAGDAQLFADTDSVQDVTTETMALFFSTAYNY
ncbi:hypothetical protein EPN96_09660 [bacterium]|nr:MAG: hypothetical protein EPN96_09660 [bacterium]